MCFSPAASFIAGSLLAIGGVYTLKRSNPRTRYFAALPLLFGIQQLIEGGVWLSFGSNICVSNAFVYAYLFFSHVFWPAYTPFALLSLERNPVRRNLLVLLSFIGIATSLFLFASIISEATVDSALACIKNNSVQYFITLAHPHLVVLLYFIATVGSCLVASNRKINYFGLVLFFSLFASLMLYYETYLSVWCFFAAILSTGIYAIVRK